MARKPAKPAPEAKPEEPTVAAPVETPAAEASLAAVVSAVEAPPPAEAPVQPPSPAPPPPAEPQGFLVVTGPKRGRWRAGWHFGPEPRRLSLAEMTEEERAAIEGDPALAVSIEAEAGAD